MVKVVIKKVTQTKSRLQLHALRLSIGKSSVNMINKTGRGCFLGAYR